MIGLKISLFTLSFSLGTFGHGNPAGIMRAAWCDVDSQLFTMGVVDNFRLWGFPALGEVAHYIGQEETHRGLVTWS